MLETIVELLADWITGLDHHCIIGLDNFMYWFEIKTQLKWTIETYLMVAVMLALIVLAVYLSVKLYYNIKKDSKEIESN